MSVLRATANPGRNDLCPCGSGRKFKVCCGTGAAVRTRQPSQPWHGGAITDAGRALEQFSPLRQALKQPAAKQRDSGQTHYKRGLALERQGDLEAAIDAYRKAIELTPGLADAHSRLGNLLFVLRRPADAVASFSKAAALAPRSTAGRIAQARALMIEDRLAPAEEVLRRAIALDPNSAVAHRTLGNILTATGRFDAAAGLLERAIELDPLEAAAFHALLTSRRITDADRALIAKAEQSLATNHLLEQQRMLVHFGVGKAYEDLREYDNAMRHFDAANAIRRQTCKLDRGGLLERLDQLTAHFSSAYFAETVGLGSQDATPILIVGMPRSGTTLVEQILSSHGSVAAGGELGFWNDRASAWHERQGNEAAIVADYLSLLRRISPDKLRVTDKNPFNFGWLGLIHLLFPNARIIHCQRDPIDTCLSIYTNHFTARMDFASDRGDLVFAYRLYRRLMAHWRAVLPANRFTEIRYESLVDDTERATRRLVEFCGLDWDPACLRPEDNRRWVKTASLWQARQPVYTTSVARRQRYAAWLGELQDLAEDAD